MRPCAGPPTRPLRYKKRKQRSFRFRPFGPSVWHWPIGCPGLPCRRLPSERSRAEPWPAGLVARPASARPRRRPCRKGKSEEAEGCGRGRSGGCQPHGCGPALVAAAPRRRAGLCAPRSPLPRDRWPSVHPRHAGLARPLAAAWALPAPASKPGHPRRDGGPFPAALLCVAASPTLILKLSSLASS